MTTRERLLAILNYKSYDRLPLVHFGFWRETLHKWAQEGHIPKTLADEWADGNAADVELSHKLGFDQNWSTCFGVNNLLKPAFEWKTIRELPDGSRHVRDGLGNTLLQAPGAVSIPAEIDHLLIDRESWETHYQWRLTWDPARVDKAMVRVGDKSAPFAQGGVDLLKEAQQQRESMLGYFAGSMIGKVRDILGIENLAYMQVDDPELLEEIIETIAILAYRCAERVLESYDGFDFVHFWEDICFNAGPLVSPDFMRENILPHYSRITQLFDDHHIHLASLDCDGMIDSLIPIWLEGGINIMFPIEVGTWNASLAPWREKYGKELRGVGGVRKHVMALDEAAVDQEVERLKPLVELGGYVPCPDHRLAPDAKWDLVQYYTQRMREVFSC